MLFDAIFAKEDQPIGPSVEWLPIGKLAAAEMDLYSTDVLESWPVEPEEDHMIGLLPHDTSVAERREAIEIVELFLTLCADLPEAQAKVAELYFPSRITVQLAKLPQLHLSPGQTFDFRQDRHGRKFDFLLAADREEAKRLI